MDQNCHSQNFANLKALRGFAKALSFIAMTMLFSFSLQALIAHTGFSSVANAEEEVQTQAPKKMDIGTHNIVIEKLNFAFDAAPKGSPQRSALALRIADLRAERARLTQMKKEEGQCADCADSREDRVLAIRLYEEALPTMHESIPRGPVVLQLAHLYEMNEQYAKAKNIYQKMVMKQWPHLTKEDLSEGHLALGELAYRENNFKVARKEFDIAVSLSKHKEGWVLYRQAWNDLNLGENSKGLKKLVKILTTQRFYKDATFQQDVSRDLATFLAREDEITRTEIEHYVRLSPPAKASENLQYLGKECDRLGKKQSSLNVWEIVLEKNYVSGPDKINAYTRLAQNSFDKRSYKAAVAFYKKALSSWQQEGCKDPDLCQDVQTRLRNFVTNWNKSGFAKDLLSDAYQAYSVVFNEDAEMAHWGAVVARDSNQHRKAFELFRKAAFISKNDKLREGSLLGEIDSAEKTKDLALKKQAYEDYLQLNPKGEKAAEVQYQLAYIAYQNKDYATASKTFKALADDHKAPEIIRVQSAELQLDILAAQKDHTALAQEANHYSKNFASRAKDFSQIEREAQQNRAASLVSQNDNAAALAALMAISFAGMKDKDQIKILKDRMIVAKKAHNLKVVEDSAEALLKFKTLDHSTRVLALENIVWIAELKLNFVKTYDMYKKNPDIGLQGPNRALKMAVLAEMSNRDPKPHYEQYLRQAPNKPESNYVRMEMIQQSRNPWKELDQQANYLRKDPALYAEAVVNVFARDPNLDKAQKHVSSPALRQSMATRPITRLAWIQNFHEKNQKLYKHNIRKDADIGARFKLVKSLENDLQAAIRSQDWTLQVVALSSLRYEQQRMLRQIRALPMPRGLNKQQKEQYKAMLNQELAPIESKIQMTEKTYMSLWTSKVQSDFKADFQKSTPAMRTVLMKENLAILKVAPQSEKAWLTGLQKIPVSRPSNKEMQQARVELIKNPFDIDALEDMKKIEEQRGRRTLVVYYENRIQAIKKGETL